MRDHILLRGNSESAYGSEESSNATFNLQKDRFQIEESTSKQEIWYEWIKQRVRRHMILELFVLICIVLVISKLHQSLSQNERNHEFVRRNRAIYDLFFIFQISNIQSELKTFKLDIESKIQSNREDEKYDEEVIEDFESSSAGKINKLKKIPEHPFRDQKNSLREFPGNQMNAASLILGATVDSSRSSSSDNNPFFGRDQSGYVLIDRFDPPSDKAWCSNEENPILTIDLAKYIRPISVSYQHSKWSGIVPDGAPRRYDVFKLEELVEEVIKDIKNPSIEINQKSKEYPKQVIPNEVNSSPNNSVFQINAASLILGATVDSSRSSNSDNNPLIGRDQSGYVLIDRSDPPSDKAWCSNEENPILTIDLAKYIRPISVSYQHSKWSGIVPDGAPNRYDVLACLDYYCNNLEPLVSNCEYKATSDNKQEQFCSIPFNKNHSSIGKIQFHFRQNHGNVMKTCAHSIRVYGETKEVPKVKERTLKQAETCSELTYDYHHKSWTYNMFDYKNCTVLYSNDCCTECPECCNECLIQDTNIETIVFSILLIIFSVILITVIFTLIAIIIEISFSKRK
ncbi:hypothetical protein CRE_09971 [Caenorhabditis remanei]|uniref:SUN domain-containing protein n=1 Tax=Caenorhabditis remanei TaxID=31234 RepID=E3M6K9_CAERE|nr:hypothetical protein CRE_09971 [Caenorhabditis remanei]